MALDMQIVDIPANHLKSARIILQLCCLIAYTDWISINENCATFLII